MGLKQQQQQHQKKTPKPLVNYICIHLEHWKVKGEKSSKWQDQKTKGDILVRTGVKVAREMWHGNETNSHPIAMGLLLLLMLCSGTG